jgi:hypothetical protein
MEPKESKSNSHFNISIAKSALRIVACYFLYFTNLQVAAVLFFVAEILGIAEEIF